MRQIAGLSAALGARLLVVIHPTTFQVEAEFDAGEPQRAFTDDLARARVPSLDLLPLLRERYASDPRPLFLDHCHHNREGAAFVAAPIHRFIERWIERPL